MFRDQLPSTHVLRDEFVQKNLQACDHNMINCAAHMILVIDNPKELVRVGLEYMVNELSVCRADAGFATPFHLHYTPIAESRNQDTEPPSITGIVIPNQHEVMQKVWHSTKPTKYESVEDNTDLKDLKSAFVTAKCKSMLIQRLLWDDEPIGISCVDHTIEDHKWSVLEVRFMETFCSKFLGPLAGISNYWFNPKMHSMFSRPSESELIAIRLAAEGFTYKQIAEKLNKSARTIENQFRNARKRLSAKNQMELLKKCEPWL